MIDTRTADDLIYTRSDLLDFLLDAESRKDSEVIVVKGHPKLLSRCKYLFWIKEGGPFEQQVRSYLRSIQKLHSYLIEFGMELKSNQGLWVPAVADYEAGDRQINVMVSENWVSKKLSISQIHDDLASSNRAEVRKQLDRAAESHSELQICRRSGQAFRVAIRNETGKQRTSGLNQYCVVLGTVEVVTNDKRYRKKRADAWRGVEEPLFTYVGREGPTWMVYPAKEENSSH